MSFASEFEVSKSDHQPMAARHDKSAVLEIDEAARSRLSIPLPVLEEKIPEFLDVFYGDITKRPGVTTMIGEPGKISRLSEVKIFLSTLSVSYAVKEQDHD